MLDLMFITNEPQMAENAERAGIGRIFIDLESQGKRERQKKILIFRTIHLKILILFIM